MIVWEDRIEAWKELERPPSVKNNDDSYDDLAWRIEEIDNDENVDLDSGSQRPQRDVELGGCLMGVIHVASICLQHAGEYSGDE